MTAEIIRETLPNLENIEQIGNPVMCFRVITKSGYVIKLPTYEENEYKTVGIIFPTTDLSTIQVLAIGDLSDGYVINGEINI